MQPPAAGLAALILMKSNRARFLLWLVMLAGVFSGQPLQAVSSHPETPPLTRLARELQDAPPPVQSDFAWLALTRMAEFYHEEAARARRESQATTQWAASVDAYAGRIASLADTITTGSVINVSVGIGNEVHVHVDGQPVILTAAISSQQAAYEADVLQRYCTLYPCDDLLQDVDKADTGLSDGSAGRDTGTVYWSFSQHAGPVCMTDDGLEFHFQQLSDLAAKRAVCDQAVAELSALVAALVREQQQGIHINWDVLVILPAGPGAGNRVRTGLRTDISLGLPLLAELPRLLEMVRPWLTARVRGDTYPLVVLDAGRILGLPETTPPEQPMLYYPTPAPDQ